MNTIKIFDAVKEGNIGYINHMLKLGANVDKKHKDTGNTLLHYASRENKYGVAKLLIEKGASLSKRNGQDYTALHIASEKGNFEIVRLLIESGSDIEETTVSKERTALHIASYEGHLDVVRLLLEAGADTSIKDTRGLVPIALALEYGHLDIVRLFVNTGYNIAEKNLHDGGTLLHYVSYYGTLDTVKFIIELHTETRVDFDVKDNKGMTAIDVARREEIKEYLIEQLEIQQIPYLLK